MLALLSYTADRHKFQDNAARNDHSLGYAERAWELLVEAYAAENFDGPYLQGLCVLVQYDVAVGNTSRAQRQIALELRIAETLPLSCWISGISDTPTVPASASTIRWEIIWSLLLLDQMCCGNGTAPFAAPIATFTVCLLPSPADISSARDVYSLDTYSLDVRKNKIAGIALVNLDLMCLAGEIFRSLNSDSSKSDKPFWMGSSARGGLLSRLLEVETKSAHHSYTSTGPVTRVLQEPHLKPYFRERTLYHLLDSACYCYLNHPFVIFMQARHLQTRLPLTFLQQSYHTARLYADWIFRLVVEMQEAGLQLYEPFTGYLVAIGASIHLEHASNEVATSGISSKEKFDQCLGFVDRLADMWPNMEKLVRILKKLRIRFQSVRTLRYVDGQYDGAQPKSGFREVSLPEEDIQLMKVLLDYAAISKYYDHADCQADTTHAEDHRWASSGPEMGNLGLTHTSASYTAESFTQGVPSDAMFGTQWDSTNAWSLFSMPWSEYYPLDPAPGSW
ncbi:hypothetical protein CKM354_001032300 [Cercospora kikuchii]|uniref:Transcription factor domain-containing protein n=1 Tax=Cercospora kikuchii TaxID=84275 RepID=A0A9P3CRA6_9PEZI|nr:uncharacterized protein CKM354_001032300 [Cercospora kikuchii]GIZ47226.1 hypothetical protein CKM354_001032300 [Cercospora kikuchii]